MHLASQSKTKPEADNVAAAEIATDSLVNRPGKSGKRRKRLLRKVLECAEIWPKKHKQIKEICSYFHRILEIVFL